MSVHLPVADMTVNVVWLFALGLAIGTLSGFFGVGGGFLLTPMLNAVLGIPYPVAVGSSLAQMTGTALSGVIRHRGLGNVDYRLGLIMAAAGVLGLHPGVAAIARLKARGDVTVFGQAVPASDLVVSLAYIPLLVGVALWMLSETKNTRQGVTKGEGHHWALARWAKTFRLAPHLGLPASGVESISVWVPVVGGALVGFMSGFLGVGGGILLLPLMVYVMGAHTATAVATSLFQVLLISVLGAVLHWYRGNVDPMLVVCVLVGGIVGAQVGATFTKYASGPHIRRYFSYLTLFAAAVVVLKLVCTLRR